MKEQLLEMINNYGFDVILEGTWAGETIDFIDYINDDPDLPIYLTENPKKDNEVINLLLGVLAEINDLGIENTKKRIEVNDKYDQLVKIFPTTPWHHQAPRVVISATETPVFQGYTWTEDAKSAGYIILK